MSSPAPPPTRRAWSWVTITALDGQPITSYEDLATLLLQYNAGATVTLEWIDETGTTQTADVVTADGPPQ